MVCISNISNESSISNPTSSLPNPALVPLLALAAAFTALAALTAAHPLLHSCFQILPAFEVEDQCCNDEKEKEKTKGNDGKDNNDTRAEAFPTVIRILLCFAADLCATLAKAERARNWLIFDDHVPENWKVDNVMFLRLRMYFDDHVPHKNGK